LELLDFFSLADSNQGRFNKVRSGDAIFARIAGDLLAEGIRVKTGTLSVRVRNHLNEIL